MTRRAILLTCLSLSVAGPGAHAEVRLAPAGLHAIAKVDPRFQSYNIEMAEVIGGRFWAPYPKPGDAAAKPNEGKSGGVDLAAGMFRKREPLDLMANRRLLNLTRALGPTYLRQSERSILAGKILADQQQGKHQAELLGRAGEREVGVHVGHLALEHPLPRPAAEPAPGGDGVLGAVDLLVGVGVLG